MVLHLAHVAQGIQARGTHGGSALETETPCYALHYETRRNKDSRWVPAMVTKVHGSRSVHVRVEENLDPGQALESMVP